jgi:acyl-CoA synthetase (NDP forming)/RimJ/RimL family protein N-acetyltransferase
MAGRADLRDPKQKPNSSHYPGGYRTRRDFGICDYSRPVPYPDHWEADVVLADGGTAHLRPIRADDAGLLREFYARLSPESIYYRFFSPRPRLTDGEIEHFTTVDYDDRVALIVTIGGAMVAVVRYDRLRPGAESAEVAFLVEDAHQGRGLASVLLEHIAAAARERGITRFVADVLPENRRMSTVFRDAGYKAEQRFEDGVLMLTLDLEPTETSREVMAAREHRAESRSIGRLLSPRSVAVIGASRDPHSVGQTVLRNLLAGGFAGPVYPVHPSAPAVLSVRAYPAISDVPGDVDLAVVAVPAEGVNEVVAQCAAKGVRGLVVLSAGFGEAGTEGRERQNELVRLARANGMRVVGPNCLGVADNAIGLNATLAPTLPRRGPVGLFSQSGALGIAILRWAAERDLGLSTFVSAGNRADVSGNDLMQYWEEDPDTAVVLLYLESIGNPRKFTRLARRISRTKPIVAVKSGRTTQGVPLGHAARALSLPDHAVSALFAQAGVVRVDSLAQLFDVAQLLAYQPRPTGNRVAVVGNSHSIGLLVQDAATVEGLDPLPPVDLGPEAGPAEFEAALEQSLADDGVDAVVTVFAPAVRGGMGSDVAAAIVRAAQGARIPVVATYLGERGLLHGSVPSYPAPEDAVRALAYAARYAGWRRRPRGRVPELAGVDRATARALIDELAGHAEPTAEQTTALLACYGIAVGAEGHGGRGVATKISTSEDPSFGAIVSFGLADVAAELLDDRGYRLAPLTDVEAAELVRAVRTAPLLLGHRGAEPVDTAALEDLLLRASRLADDLPEVARLDLDPVLAGPAGAVVRGARLRLAGPPGRHAEDARRLRSS